MLPEQYETIDQLLDNGRLDQAKNALDALPASDNRYEALRIKVGLLDGSVPPMRALQQLTALMRQNPDHPGAKALYQMASSLAYQTGQSSMAHSHPPPPTKPKS